jgi:hypothetical protein
MLQPPKPIQLIRGFCALCTAHCAKIATAVEGKVVRFESHIHLD